MLAFSVGLRSQFSFLENYSVPSMSSIKVCNMPCCVVEVTEEGGISRWHPSSEYSGAERGGWGPGTIARSQLHCVPIGSRTFP